MCALTLVCGSIARGDWVTWPASVGGNGHAYLPVIASNLMSWDTASREAAKLGGYLATLTSPEENDFVYNLISAPSHWNGQFGPLFGAYQPAGSPEPAGGWTWVSGEPWGYSNWRSGQPDNAGQEDGAHFWGVKTWNDTPTNHPGYIAFIVERDICTPHRATATAQVVNGFVVGATIVDTGCGYTNAPVVLIQGGGGAGATATALVTNGEVAAIQIVSAGCCYTNAPRIVIASPPFAPKLDIDVSKVRVIQSLVLGRRYILETSTNNQAWIEAIPSFTANDESITNEFNVDTVGRFFRVREVP